MDVYDAILRRRSIRRFKQKFIEFNTLKRLINCARLAPSAANIQPLEYIIVTRKELLNKVFQTLKWAAYIAPRGNPKEGEKPTAYIIVLINKNKESFPAEWDVGAAVENILLAALNEGIGSCWLGSIGRKRLYNILGLSDNYKIDSVIALGYSLEEPVVEKWRGDVKYFKDEKNRLHVPKRDLEEIIYDVI